MEKEFIDAFIKNKAPFIVEEVGLYGREVKRYLPEAYTDMFMIRSEKTNRLCRYVVQTDSGVESLYGYYGIRYSGKNPVNSCLSLFEKMNNKDLVSFIKNTFTERFPDLDSAIDFLGEYQWCKYRTSEPEKYSLVNKYMATTAYSLIEEK